MIINFGGGRFQVTLYVHQILTRYLILPRHKEIINSFKQRFINIDFKIENKIHNIAYDCQI